MKVFLIQKIDYDYNDEYYEECGGTPIKVYKDKQKALKIMEELNAQYKSKHGWYSFTNWTTGKKEPPQYIFIDSENNKIEDFYKLVELEIDQ